MYGDVFHGYFKLLVRICYHLNSSDMFWCVDFILGSVAFTRSGANTRMAIVKSNYGIDDNLEGMLRIVVSLVVRV